MVEHSILLQFMVPHVGTYNHIAANKGADSWAELQPVGSPHKISLGRTESCEKGPMLEQGERIKMKAQQRQTIMD